MLALFIAQQYDEFIAITTKSKKGGCMAAERITPVDELTGLPLSIVPTRKKVPSRNPNVADWHHHFHPKEDPRLKTVGGLALRNSRLQLVFRTFHNEGPHRYHRFFDGPPIPQDEATQFGMCVLACAGYIPENGIDLRGDVPVVKRLTEEQRSILATPNIDKNQEFDYHHFRYGYEPIRSFFIKYTLDQDLTSVVPESSIDEFLYTRDTERRKEKGSTILELAASAATEGMVDANYALLRDMHLLHEAMPPEPHKLVYYKLGRMARQETDVFPRLKTRLRQLVAA